MNLAENIKTIINPPEGYDKKCSKKFLQGDAKEILSKFIEILKNSKNISSPEDYQKVWRSLLREKR